MIPYFSSLENCVARSKINSDTLVDLLYNKKVFLKMLFILKTYGFKKHGIHMLTMKEHIGRAFIPCLESSDS